MKRPMRVVVVGAGPAGLLAAGSAARIGASVRIIERNSAPGVKLLITGKGRCNISNTASIKEFVQAFAPDGRFLYRAFSRFFREDLVEILTDNGVQVKVERGGRLFPFSDRAADVLLALLSWVKSAGVEIRTGTRCTGLLMHQSALAGVKITGGTIEADKIILATGGASYPRTGSTGDGYRLAASAGHTVVTPLPSLVPLVVKEGFVAKLEGISLRNVRATVISDDRTLASETGEMVFTSDGLSGPIILTLSRLAVPLLAERRNVVISIDLKPAISEQELRS
jgi:predicted Rossmann fold flavoprotein